MSGITEQQGTKMIWSDERKDRVKDLWTDGWTASQIGKEMGVSRNSVIGVVHRAGLQRDPSLNKANNSVAYVWTEERQAEANKVIKACTTYAEAARKLDVPLPALKAAIYKWNLHKIPRRFPVASENRAPRPKRPPLPKADKPKERLQVLEAFVASTVDSPAPRDFMTRHFGECAYPVSGEGADTLSCCNPALKSGYCAGHHSIMFEGVPPKKAKGHFAVAIRHLPVDKSIFRGGEVAQFDAMQGQIRLGFAA
jgi:GcrA cell cycle regulator